MWMKLLHGHVRQNLDDTEAALIGFYSSRTYLFQEAFWAHREGRYSLSIQAFLTQADGIFCDRFGKQLFRGGSQEAVSDFSSEVRGRFFQAHLHSLTHVHPTMDGQPLSGRRF